MIVTLRLNNKVNLEETYVTDKDTEWLKVKWKNFKY